MIVLFSRGLQLSHESPGKEDDVTNKRLVLKADDPKTLAAFKVQLPRHHHHPGSSR
jgi:hypothetical protein